jgi:hypothetical protein
MLELMVICVDFKLEFLKLIAETRLPRWFNGGSDDSALRPLLLLKIRSVRMLDTIVCSVQFGAIGLAVLSGLGRRYTHPGRWIHLPFRGHWNNNGSYSTTNDF